MRFLPALFFPALLACSPKAENDAYIPHIPEPPPKDHVARMREALAEVEATRAPARAESLYNMVRRYRGDLAAAAPSDLQALGPSIIDVLAKIRKDKENAYVRCMLIASAALTRHPDAVLALIGLAGEETDEGVLPTLLDALGASQDTRALGVLLRRSASESALIRKFAVFNLAAIKEPAAIATLQSKLADPAEEVRWSAAFGLAFFHRDKSGFDILLKMLSRDHLKKHIAQTDADAELRTQNTILLAIKGLLALRDPAAIEPLRAVIRTEPSESLKDACRETIRQLESPR